MNLPFRISGTRHRPIDIGRDRCIKILRVLDGGWEIASADPRVNPGAREIEITECLRRGMEEALNRGVVPDGKQIWIGPGTEWHSQSEVLERDGVVDIPIRFTQIREVYGEHDPHAIIECKRIAGRDPDLCRLYVVEGIDRFSRGSRRDRRYPRYAANHSVGFMAGYLTAGDVGDAVNGINRYLGKERQSEQLGTSTILSVDWARSSSHPRLPPLAPIVLHHAFLGF